MRRMNMDGTPIPHPFRNGGVVPKGLFVDLDGRPIEHTPWEYHYSYDEYVEYKSPRFTKADHWDYSDRLWEWAPNKFRDAVASVWPDKPHSQMFYDKKHTDIEKFLRAYYGKDVILTAVVRGCNKGDGNPYWVFAYQDPPEGADAKDAEAD